MATKKRPKTEANFWGPWVANGGIKSGGSTKEIGPHRPFWTGSHADPSSPSKSGLNGWNKANNQKKAKDMASHKKLRSKSLTPVIIREVTRRCHVVSIWQAIYTAGVTIDMICVMSLFNGTSPSCSGPFEATHSASMYAIIIFNGLLAEMPASCEISLFLLQRRDSVVSAIKTKKGFSL